MRARALMAAALVVAAEVACSSSTASPPTTPTDDASTDGGELAAGFDCLGAVKWPAPQSAKVTLGVSFVDYAIDGPKDAFTMPLALKACATSDGACATSLATATTDATGSASFEVATGASGFDGYIEASGADRMTLLAFFVPPIAASSGALQNARGIPSRKTMEEIASTLGTSLDASRGHILVRARNCTNIGTAADVSFAYSTADTKSVAFVYERDRPKAGVVTDSSGLAGALNLPPGPISVRATLESAGRVLGNYSFIVRADSLTSSSAPPTP